jgi:hypothetical protein
MLLDFTDIAIRKQLTAQTILAFAEADALQRLKPRFG